MAAGAWVVGPRYDTLLLFTASLRVPALWWAQLPFAALVPLYVSDDARFWRFNLYPERGRWLRLFAPKPA